MFNLFIVSQDQYRSQIKLGTGFVLVAKKVALEKSKLHAYDSSMKLADADLFEQD